MTKFQHESLDLAPTHTSAAEIGQSRIFEDAYAAGAPGLSARGATRGMVVADSSADTKSLALGNGPIIVTAPGKGPFSGPVISSEPLTPAQATKALAERFKL